MDKFNVGDVVEFKDSGGKAYRGTINYVGTSTYTIKVGETCYWVDTQSTKVMRLSRG